MLPGQVLSTDLYHEPPLDKINNNININIMQRYKYDGDN